jgi:hypothetical protein
MNTKATKTNKPPQAQKAQRRERKKLRNIREPFYLEGLSLASLQPPAKASKRTRQNQY